MTGRCETDLKMVQRVTNEAGPTGLLGETGRAFVTPGTSLVRQSQREFMVRTEWADDGSNGPIRLAGISPRPHDRL
jgi:hypothetical protein